MSLEKLLRATQRYLESRGEPEVVASFKSFDWQLSPRPLEPEDVPGVRHLPGVLANCATAERELAVALLEAQPDLRWGRSYAAEDFGQHFVDNYGYMELIGTRGHFSCERLAVGFVMFGPAVEYPAHWHVAEELYFPLTSGGLWSRDSGDFTVRQSGEFISHPSNMPHAMTTTTETLLALYVWCAPPGVVTDLAQKSNYSATK